MDIRMEGTTKVVIGLAAIGAGTLLPGAAVAQDREHAGPETGASHSVMTSYTLSGMTVVVRVDGMVCPFCAYGLEKRLGEIAAVDSVIVQLSDGLVQIREREGRQVSDAVLRQVVTKAGFTVREVSRNGSGD